jgi:AcrR family transcriptional regulator
MRTAHASKGAATREVIVARALEIAAERGLDALTIGMLAEATGMSKSGVFAHFGSREDLQLAVLDGAAREFSEQVFVPALRERRGLPRLRAILERWMTRTLTDGIRRSCPIGAAAVEFDDRPGPVRERVLGYVLHLRREVARAVRMAVEHGDLAAATDADQLAFELHALMTAFVLELKLFGPEAAEMRVRASIARTLGSVTTPAAAPAAH